MADPMLHLILFPEDDVLASKSDSKGFRNIKNTVFVYSIHSRETILLASLVLLAQ
jgi:hypothetical protein